MGGLFGGGADTKKAERRAEEAEERQKIQQSKLSKERAREEQKKAGRQRALSAGGSGTLYKGSSILGVKDA